MARQNVAGLPVVRDPESQALTEAQVRALRLLKLLRGGGRPS
jgi:hypothetical protein